MKKEQILIESHVSLIIRSMCPQLEISQIHFIAFKIDLNQENLLDLNYISQIYHFTQ